MNDKGKRFYGWREPVCLNTYLVEAELGNADAQQQKQKHGRMPSLATTVLLVSISLSSCSGERIRLVVMQMVRNTPKSRDQETGCVLFAALETIAGIGVEDARVLSPTGAHVIVIDERGSCQIASVDMESSMLHLAPFPAISPSASPASRQAVTLVFSCAEQVFQEIDDFLKRHPPSGG